MTDNGWYCSKHQSWRCDQECYYADYSVEDTRARVEDNLKKFTKEELQKELDRRTKEEQDQIHKEVEEALKYLKDRGVDPNDYQIYYKNGHLPWEKSKQYTYQELFLENYSSGYE